MKFGEKGSELSNYGKNPDSVKMRGSASGSPRSIDSTPSSAETHPITTEERHRVLVKWNQTAKEYPKDRCIHQLFEEQVTRGPGRVALVAGKKDITYGELNTRANQVAHMLRKSGVGPDVLVGICLERSADLVVGILGILKAGGAYLPLDPKYPVERLAFMVKDTRAPIVLTQESLADSLNLLDHEEVKQTTRLICLDRDRSRISRESGENIHAPTTPENLAYVIYTSGSTGNPKGVAIEHRNTVALIHWALETYNHKELAGVLTSTSVCFDLSVFELFVTLAGGGTCVLVSDALELLGNPASHPITLINTVPSVIAELVRAKAIPESVTTVNLAGELLPAQLVDLIYEETSVRNVYDLYGPSETTTYSTHTLRAPHGRQTIGRPIANTKIYILDPKQEPVPAGVTGELYIGGQGLARGYLNRPELTAEKFIPNPFAESSGERLYRTGDLGRFLPDGAIEYIGRLDHQLKIRGHRIEPGEIETALRAFPEVRDSVVMAVEERPGDKRLVAYVVGTEGEGVDPEKLRKTLAQQMPQYLVPSAFVCLDAFPLTNNKKIDRRALPKPDWGKGSHSGEFVPPQTDTEKQLAAIWKSLLRIEAVGGDANFFDLGGHSLLVVQLKNQVQKHFGVDLPIHEFFEYPTIADLGERIGEGRRVHLESDYQSKAPIPVGDGHPTSFAQQRMWFLQQQAPDSPFYNVSWVLRLRGPLNVAALTRALQTLDERHDSLRTTYHWRGNTLLAQAHPPAELRIQMHDLRTLPLPERENRFHTLAKEESGRLFDLEAGPAWRQQLYQLADSDYGLAITFHHIGTDEWSKAILQKELGILYRNFTGGQTSELDPPTCRYVDYARWQLDLLRQGKIDNQLEYWRKQLSGVGPALEVPGDHSRPAKPSYRGASESILCGRSLLDKLNALGRELHVTLFMTLLGSFQVLLQRYTGQDDIVVGTPIANRPQIKFQKITGLFLNTLAMRTDLKGRPTVRETLKRVRDVALGAMENQTAPFEQVVQQVRAERRDYSDPLIHVLFTLTNAMGKPWELGDLEVSYPRLGSGTAKFDLTLFARQEKNGLQLGLNYRTDLFEAATVRRMLNHLEQLLEGMADQPDTAISKLPLLTEKERGKMLLDWNRTERKFPEDRRVHQLFEQRAAQSPDSVAVIFGDQQLTYRELNDRANQLARFLKGRGLKPNGVAGLCLSRSPELITGILGVLKAGGACLPLDHACPRARLEFMLSDTKVELLLTEEALQSQLPAIDAPTICLDGEASGLAAMDPSDPVMDGGSDPLAYTLYTTGSADQPKAVAITHSAVVNLLTAMEAEPGLTSRDRVLAVTTPAGDLSVAELLLPLTVGACVDVLSSELISDLPGLVDRVSNSGATVMQATPSLWWKLIKAGWEGTPGLKVLCGRETLSKPLADGLRKRCGELWNLYGSTETTVWSTLTRVDETTVPGSIGRPLGNTQVYVLDSHQEPVPIGVAGELYIGGAGLARGYPNDPMRTAEKFVANPFGTAERDRLYRTGDRGRWRADGSLEYLGRQESRVALQGHLIELEEIESTLNEQETVAQSVVIPREERPGEERLVAYCVPRNTGKLDLVELKTRLRKQLPPYKVPAVFVSLDNLPLSPDGKIDRRALPEPTVPDADPESGYIAPRSPIEERLAAIWSDVLGLAKVGIHNNFFEMGGHSLLAVRVHARTISAFEVDLPLSQIYDSPTLAEFAAEIERVRQSGTQYQPNAIPQVESAHTEPLPLSFGQQRLWFLEQLESGLTAYNMPSAIRLHGDLRIAALERSLQRIIERHEPLRTTFSDSNGVPVQEIRTIDRLAIPLIRLEGLSKEEQDAAISEYRQVEIKRPFDLGKDLMIRPTLLRFSQADHVLLLTMHHIAFDGWSVGILYDELSQLYAALVEDREPSLPALPVRYSDYALWQREQLSGEPAEQLIAYWTQRLKTAPAEINLPKDFPRREEQTFQGLLHTIALDAEPVRKLSRQAGTTSFNTMLAAFQIFLSRLSGQEEVVVGVPVAGRNRVEAERLIGFFVNTLVLNNDLSGNPTFREVLTRVRSTTIDALAHQELPFERLVEALKPQQDLSTTPLFQVLFNNVDFQSSEFKLPGITIEKLGSLDRTNSKYDLTIYLQNHNSDLKLRFVYNANLFRPERIEEMGRQFKSLVSQIIEEPDLHIDTYSLVTSEAARFLPNPQQDLESPPQENVVDQVEAWADSSPDQVAISKNESTWTYQDLAAVAERLSQVLTTAGIKRGETVGLLGMPGFGLISSLIGILKAGAVAVPVDANLPATRIATLLQEAGVRLLVQAGGTVSAEDSPANAVATLAVDEDTGAVQTGGELELEKAKPGSGGPLPEDAAYIFFTSGTTGKPKGIIGSHKGLSHFLNWQRREFNVGPRDHVAQVTGLSFDVVMREIFLPLTSGATLCLPEQGIDEDGGFWDWLDQQKVTILHSVPSRVQAWLAKYPADRAPNAIRLLFMVGEPLSDTLVRAWRTSIPGEIINLYGATETGPAKLCHRVPANDQLRPGIQLLGGPLPETQALILSYNNRQCGIGELGEIAVRTPFLPLGYLQSEENKGRFVRNPFSSKSTDLLYRTGDLGRYLPDGQVEIVGRLDDQVKIRGVRIEPVEVANALSAHDQVTGCFVGSLKGENDAVKLVAWVVTKNGRDVTGHKLRTFLVGRLPMAFAPSHFVFVEKIPLTSNGKVDREALPTPEDWNAEAAGGRIQPRTLTEEMLARIWIESLQLPDSPESGPSQIHIYDNFFDVGGHSLMATQFIHQIRRVLKVEMPVRQLFKTPTIAELADYIDVERKSAVAQQNPAGQGASPLIPIQSGGSQKPFFLVPGGGGGEEELIVYSRLIYLLGKEQPVYGFRAQRHEEKLPPYPDVKAMAADYVTALRTVQPQGPYLLGGECVGGVVAFEMAQQLIALGEQVGLLVLMDTAVPTLRGAIRFKLRQFFKTRRIALHRKNLKPLSLKDRLLYMIHLASKTQKRLVEGSSRWQVHYIKIIKKYRPRSYAGHLTWLVTENFSRHIKHSWRPLAKGGLKMHPLVGNHNSYLGKNVATTAEKLKECIQKAQTKG